MINYNNRIRLTEKAIGIIDYATGAVNQIVRAEQIQCPTCYSHISYCTCKTADITANWSTNHERIKENA